MVDECEHHGPPDTLTIRGKSANFRESLNVKREQSYDSMTIEKIASQIAKRHNLEYKLRQRSQIKPLTTPTKPKNQMPHF